MLAQDARPTAPDHLAGKAAIIHGVLAKGLALQQRKSDCVFLSGPSGTGKTTLARMYAREFAGPHSIITPLNGTELTVEHIRDIQRTSRARPWCSVVWIVDEAHKIRAGVRDALLSAMEDLAPGLAIILTSTTEGTTLFEDSDASEAFSSRCRLFRTERGKPEEMMATIRAACERTSTPWDETIAKRAAGVAKGNFRAALAEYETLLNAV